MSYVNVRFHVSNETEPLPIYTEPMTFGSDPRCQVLATEQNTAPLAGVIWHTEWGILVFCADGAPPISIKPQKFGEPHRTVLPGVTRLFQHGFGFDIGGVIGAVDCSADRENSFKSATRNKMRELLTTGKRMDDGFFNLICFPILSKNSDGIVTILPPLPADDLDEEEIDR